MGLALTLPVAAQSPPSAATSAWKLSTALGPAYAQGKAGEIWATLLRERSHGHLQVALFPGATLAQRDPAREFAALRDGGADLAVGSAATWAMQVQALNLVALPWLLPDAEALDVLRQSDVIPMLAARVEAAGVVPLAWASAGFSELATARAMHAPADLKALALRASASPLQRDMLLALGSRPASMSAETALAGQTSGALDGEVTSVAAYGIARLYAGGMTHLLLWGAQADLLLFAVNRKLWDGLDDEDRDLVRQAAQDAAADAGALIRAQTDNAALEALARQGATVTRLTRSGKQPFRDATRAVYDRWAAVIGPDLVHAAEAAIAAPR